MKQKLTLICLLIASVLFAQEGEKKAFSFTLQQAIDHAIENNYSSINANRDIEAAKQKNGKPLLLGCHKFPVIYNT